jgi:hypothetical protein
MIVTDQLEQSITELYTRETEYGQAGQDAAEAEHNYKIRHAKKYLEAEGSIEARKATAILECAKEHLEYLRTEAVRDFCREKLRDSQQCLSARQSLLSFSARSDQSYSNDRRVV